MIETFQTPSELKRLVQVVDLHAPSRVLEIGCWDGGTLSQWLSLAEMVVAVDDRMRRADDWRAWADEAGVELHTIWGLSQDERVIAEAREHAPFDFMFIDGAHDYDSVRADWENYLPMMAPGGLVAFHDIVARPDYGVSDLWAEIKSVPGTRWMEIGETVEERNPTKHGIGLVWL